MKINWHNSTKQFHLYNDQISYVMCVQPNGELGQLYFGTTLHDGEDLSYLSARAGLSLVTYYDMESQFSLELNRQEYPSFGNGDFGSPAFRKVEADGSAITNLKYVSHEITASKKALPGLPALYGSEEEVSSLEIELVDERSGLHVFLTYSIFRDYPVIARSARFVNRGQQEILLDRAMSICLDLPDANYDWMQFSGAWARERIPVVKKLDQGITAIESKRGHSSPNQNPFVILKRPNTDEFSGEAFGFSFEYSGNFLAQAEVDTYGKLRFLMGMHPDTFSWTLAPGEEFVTPEAIMARTTKGLNDLSQTFHDLFNHHLVRGKWKNKQRPILLNNWEATFMDFTEDSILKIASKAKEAGAELFVLDDGWFGQRNDDHRGLGDWIENPAKLPNGMKGLAEKVEAMGLKFGFWIEPEMVNPDSDLYRAHPEWALAVPDRAKSLGRWQMVLDYSKPEVVDYIYDLLYRIIKDAPISYIKWDMNRSLTECFSQGLPAKEQGRVYHKHILGVYNLYERLEKAFPEILFESCSSGGGRFDAGMLYYAPQAWCSDNTDAEDRIMIQYGTSYGYPISSIGAHVSAVPNQQTGRTVPISMRGNVAMFGAFGYELDLNHISEEEFEEVKKQIEFVKEHRELLQYGKFYRLRSPFETNQAAWMVVSEDQNTAILALYTMRATCNTVPGFLKLAGLDPNKKYQGGDRVYCGDALMEAGIPMRPDCVPGYYIGNDGNSAIMVLRAADNHVAN